MATCTETPVWPDEPPRDPGCFLLRPRDVVVLGTAGVADRISDVLRQAGLSVGSALVPSTAAPAFARFSTDRDLYGPAVRAAWGPAALIVSLWTGPVVAAAVEPLVDRALRGRRPATVWLQLSPHPHVSPGPRTLLAPVLAGADHHVRLPAQARRLLGQMADGDLGRAVPVFARAAAALLERLPHADATGRG